MPSDDRKELRWLTRLLFVLVLLAGVRGLGYRIRVQFGDVSGSLLDDTATNVGFYAVYALGVGSSFGSLKRVAQPWIRRLFVFHGVLILSSLWSINWQRTLNQTLLFAVGSIALVGLSSLLSVREVVVAAASASHGVLLLSLVAVAGDWEFSIDNRGYWAGALFNRNALGMVACIALVSTGGCWWLSRRAPIDHFVGAGGVALGLWIWWQTKSATPMIAAIVALGAAGWMFAMQRFPRRRRMLASVPVVALVAGAVAFAKRATLAGWVGRDATFTGRTSTWDLVVDTWSNRPINGFGFFAGWVDPGLRAGLKVIGFNHWEAHNGYLEVLLGAGLVGLVALAWLLWLVVRQFVVCRRVVAAPWFAAAMAFFVVVNLGETAIGANRLPWFLFVAVATQLASLGRTERRD